MIQIGGYDDTNWCIYADTGKDGGSNYLWRVWTVTTCLLGFLGEVGDDDDNFDYLSMASWVRLVMMIIVWPLVAQRVSWILCYLDNLLFVENIDWSFWLSWHGVGNHAVGCTPANNNCWPEDEWKIEDKHVWRLVAVAPTCESTSGWVVMERSVADHPVDKGRLWGSSVGWLRADLWPIATVISGRVDKWSGGERLEVDIDDPDLLICAINMLLVP